MWIGGRTRSVSVAALALALTATAPALGAWPGSPPGGSYPESQQSPRVDTPNDTKFDHCEGDDETTSTRECESYFNEQFGAFGFRPDSARDLAGKKTHYVDCSQLNSQGRDANTKAEEDDRQEGDECVQISGVRADSAWKFSTGDPDVVVAILDTGMRWEARELIEKIHLNTGELPKPEGSTEYDANGDHKVTVSDWTGDSRVAKEGGDDEADGVLDASDLIAAFSDGSDADGNGYGDDIAGWDFFNDDNDPFDASSCCSAVNHGRDRALQAARETNDRKLRQDGTVEFDGGEAGMCPKCQVMPLRVWDTFVVDTNLYALATVYAADNGASVVEGAVGGLLNSSFARRAFTYADRKGVTLTLVSSDINSANHNYPTNYNEAIYVGGSLPDSAPNERCEFPNPPDPIPKPPKREIPFCKEFLDATGIEAVSGQPPTTSFFRNANLTQYGGKADIVLVGSTGSSNTAQAAGAAGLLQSYARERFRDQSAFPKALSGNEIRQLLTMSAEDVLPQNTGRIGLPDKAEKGWDPHFGYGRVNLAGAMRKIQAGQIPPEVQLDAPDWFAPIDVDKVGADGVPISGRVASPHFAGEVRWRLEYVCGQDAPDADFKELVSGSGSVSGQLGRLSRKLLEDLADNCEGSVADDAGRPAGRLTDGPWPDDPYPKPDPERHAFQIRLRAWEAADENNVGVYRKTLFAYRDDGTASGWPRPLGAGSVAAALLTGSGGESSPRLVDLDADNELDVLLPTSSGELYALRRDGEPLPSFNNGNPVRTRPYAVANAHEGAGGLDEGLLGNPPREPLRVPAVGDVTADGEPEIVVTAGEHLYAWHRDGSTVEGFPQRIEPSLSQPCKAGVANPCFHPGDRAITGENHIKRGFLGSPALAYLDGDRRLDIVAGSLDQHVYAWNGRGRVLDGFPKRLDSDEQENGAEIITSPAIANLDGDREDEVVLATNEVIDGPSFSGGLNPENFLSLFAENTTGANVVYALNGDATLVSGWPVKIGTLAGNVLPLVLPSHDAAVVNVDGGNDEVSLSAATGSAKLVKSNGETVKTYDNTPAQTAGVADRSPELNLADYPSIGRLSPVDRPSVFKGGLSLNGAANLVAVNQNLPFNHTVQAWEPTSGHYLSGFPVATDDYQLLSQPTIANVDGPGAGRQALVGTGLYQLHAYGAGGGEPDGWPKFAGGWIQSTPAVGDVDGDRKLDVAAMTREGWSFLWKTDAPECRVGTAATNEEWWTFHHDEHGTANYGHDARPPSRPLRVFRAAAGDGALRLSFKASGDDLRCGDAERYQAAGSDEPIRNGADFVAARQLETEKAAATTSARDAGGDIAIVAKDGAHFRHVAIRAVDDFGNRSYVSPEAERSQSGAGSTPGSGGGGQGGGSPGGGSGPGGDLPFTGFALAVVGVAGLALSLLGLTLRRRLRR